jgi:RNA polymerase sigma factor (sigma-70 family)
LPLVYEELRTLAAAKLAHEKPGQTLQATALVHEAYLRLVGGKESRARSQELENWNSRGHFFAAAAEAMRRILVENARRKARVKHGGELERQDIELGELLAADSSNNLLALDEALDQLAANDGQAEALTRLTAEDPEASRLIQLRYFAGLSIEDAAELVGISRSTAYEHWSYARVRLRTLLNAD